MPKTITAKSHIRVVKFILSGDTDVMRKMAFGDQQVDFGHGDNVDNSQIRRCRQIERWAIDVRRFMAQRYGDENIMAQWKFSGGRHRWGLPEKVWVLIRATLRSREQNRRIHLPRSGKWLVREQNSPNHSPLEK